MKVKDSYSKLLQSLLTFALLIICHNVSAFTLIEIPVTVDIAGTNVAEPVLTETQVDATASTIGNHVQNAIRGVQGRRELATNDMLNMSGINAGDGIINVGAWASGGYTDYEDDFVSTALDGDTTIGLIGIDIAPTEYLLLGVAVGYENSDVVTTFNFGAIESDGYTVAPYFGLIFNDHFSIDGSFGYSEIDSDQTRVGVSLVPGGVVFSSSPSSERYFATVNLNAITTVGNWFLGGRGGFFYAKNDQDAFIESSSSPLVADINNAGFETEIKQWNIGGEIGYGIGNFEPFARGSYERLFDSTEIIVLSGPQPSNDEDSYLVGGGVRYFGTDGLSASLEWDRRLGRDNFDEDRFSLVIRGDF
jgi:hypothetical protein